MKTGDGISDKKDLTSLSAQLKNCVGQVFLQRLGGLQRPARAAATILSLLCSYAHYFPVEVPANYGFRKATLKVAAIIVQDTFSHQGTRHAHCKDRDTL